MIRLIALDLDGTSLRANGALSPGLEQAVSAAEALGVKVILATGRMIQSAELFWRNLGLSPGPVIVYNGAAVIELPGGALWFRDPVDDAAARLIVERGMAAGILVQVYVGKELWVSRDNARVRDYVRANHVPVAIRSGAELTAWPEPPLKILLQDEPAVVDAFRAEMTPLLADYPVRLFKSQHDYLEMVGAEVGKGRALARVADRLAVPRTEVMAIGDNENDIDMISWAGLGVAMGQSGADVRAVADVVTGSVDDGGAAAAIRRYVLGEDAPGAAVRCR